MFSKIKSFFQAQKDLAKLRAEFSDLKEKHASLEIKLFAAQDRVGDPRLVVEKIFGRGIKWFDYKELPTEGQRKYFKDAQTILNSDVFNNIINLIIARSCQECIRQYNLLSGVNPSRDVQMIINGLDLLKEELESIPDPDFKKEKTDFNPYE